MRGCAPGFSIALLIVSSAMMISLPFLAAAQKTRTTTPVKPGAPTQDDDIYVCLMHPDVMSDKPGKCPKCAMTLVRTRRPEEAEHEIRLATAHVVVQPGA